MRGALDVLREPRFRLLFVSQTGSALGSSLVPVALAFAVLEVGGSATSLGLVLASSRVPMVVFVLAGGVVGDRFPRRLVMLGSDVARLGTQATTAVLLLTGHATLWELALLQAAHGTAAAFFNPAATGLVPQTVTPSHLQEANALLGLSRNATAIAGQVAAGAVVATLGPGAAFLVDSASYGVSAGALGRLRVDDAVRSGPRTSVLRELAAGWTEFSSRTWLWAGAAHVALLNGLVLAPFFVLAPIVAARALGGAPAFAAITAAFAAGAVAGGALGLRWHPHRPLVAAFAVVFAAAPQLALLAAEAPIAAIAAATFLGGAQATFFNAAWATTLQENVPPDAISRVDAYGSLGMLTLAPIGYAAAGPAAAAVGTSAVLWFGVCWTLTTTAAILLAGSLRGVTRGDPTARAGTAERPAVASSQST